MIARDGHIHVLPLHVANQIAAGEVVERPASVVKELVENAIDAGAKNIRIALAQGGRKLIAVQDDGCGMTKEDAVLALERQATSKILDVHDIEEIDTLGFRGEAIPSIASVSRFTLTTRRADSDEGTLVQVDAGTVAEIRAAGCPPGTLVEVRDLFCNVPARRKFLRAVVTEENHVKSVFMVHALAHPDIGFSLTLDGRELYRLAPAANVTERITELFGADFVEDLLPLAAQVKGVKVSGLIEKPNLNLPTRRDQFVFVNGRPATAASIAYAIREAYPRRQGDVRPALFLFLELPANQVDVNVHPTKREVRFRDNLAVKNAITAAIEAALGTRVEGVGVGVGEGVGEGVGVGVGVGESVDVNEEEGARKDLGLKTEDLGIISAPSSTPPTLPSPSPAPAPVAIELPLAADEHGAKPWKWFKFLALTDSGYLLIETDTGVVTINPHAARERIAFEHLSFEPAPSQTLLIPETVKLSPTDAARLSAALPVIESFGFKVEPFGADTFKIDAVPQLIGALSPAAVMTTIARDLAEGGVRRSGRWREELIAKSIARSFAGSALKLTAESATKLVEDLAACKMPYVCPRGKPIMIFTSTRELDRKFAK